MNNRQRWALFGAFFIVCIYVVGDFIGAGSPEIVMQEERQKLLPQAHDRFPLEYDFDTFIDLVMQADTLRHELQGAQPLAFSLQASRLDTLLAQLYYEEKKFSSFVWETRAREHHCSVRQERALAYYTHVLKRKIEQLNRLKRFIPAP